MAWNGQIRIILCRIMSNQCHRIRHGMHGVSGAIDQVNQVVSGWDGHGARDFQVIMVLFVACGRDAPNGGWRNYMELLYRIRTYPTPLLLGADHFLRSSICHHFSISCNSLSKDLTQYKKKHVSGVLSILSDKHGRFMTFPILLHHLQPVHPMSIVHPLIAALEQFCASKVGISPTCGTRFDTVVLS